MAKHNPAERGGIALVGNVVPIIGDKGGGGSEPGKIGEAFQAAKEWFAKN